MAYAWHMYKEVLNVHICCHTAPCDTIIHDPYLLSLSSLLYLVKGSFLQTLEEKSKTSIGAVQKCPLWTPPPN